MKSILLVDDESDFLEVLSNSFKLTQQFTVVGSTDGQDAHRRSLNQSFDVICTDFRMPKLNGAQVILAIRSGSFHAKTPIVVLSGHIEEAQNECRALGIDKNLIFVSKPVVIKKLVDIINTALAPKTP